MVFSSLIFIFLFLPLVTLGYLITPKRLKNFTLLVASFVFYSWGEPKYIGLMILSIFINYFFGLLLESRLKDKAVLAYAISINVALLVFFKYANFMTNNLDILLGVIGIKPILLSPIHLPIGISFYTFHSISYLVDIYRKKATAQRNFLDLALYISLFPQLVAGPIIRYHDVADQIKHRSLTIGKFSYGIRRFIIGFSKKVIIANTLSTFVDQIFAIQPEGLTTGLAWLGAISYMLQIYYDFSAYSDMAIGLASMFGFSFMENFNYPYISRDIKEFWRRWHISLCNWFRDYVYVPLGGNRKGIFHTYKNLIIVFFLSGLWHGAGWNFIIWGLYHGFFLVLERTRFERMLNLLWRPIRHLYALLVILIGWVFFRTETLPDALNFIKALFGVAKGTGEQYYVGMFLTNEVVLILLLAIVGSIPILPRLLELKWSASRTKTLLNVLQDCFLFALFSVSLLYLIVILQNTTYIPFIYFRF